MLIIASLIDWHSKNIYFDHLALLLAAMMLFLTLSDQLSMKILLVQLSLEVSFYFYVLSVGISTSAKR